MEFYMKMTITTNAAKQKAATKKQLTKNFFSQTHEYIAHQLQILMQFKINEKMQHNPKYNLVSEHLFIYTRKLLVLFVVISVSHYIIIQYLY